MSYRTLMSWLLAVLCQLLVVLPRTASALEPPRPGEVEHLKQTGEYADRLERVLALGNHRIEPGLLERALYQARREALIQQGVNPDDVLPAPPAARRLMPTKGNVKVFALLIDFLDYPGYSTQAAVHSALFGDGSGIPTNPFPYESLNNFYERSSYNQLHLSSGLTLGWYHAPYNRSSVPQTTAGREALIKEAIASFDGTVDFSQFNNDTSDNKIEYFCVIWTGPNNGWGNFWWGYYTGWSDSTYTVDGVTLGRYSWQYEGYYGAYGPFNPSTVIHETGHGLGLPDYYDYDDSVGPDGGVGGLDTMDAKWGDHNSFSKWVLEWITPTVVATGSQTLTLSPSGTSQDAVLVMPGATSTDAFREFFIAQNRYRAGNDSNEGYPTDGMLIWHVDARLNTAGTNYAYDNSYTAHKLLKLMQADGLDRIENSSAWADAAMYYTPGSSLGPLTAPSSQDYLGVDTGVNVTGISQSWPQMTATFSVAAECETIMTQDFEGTFPVAGWTLYGDPTWDDDDYKPYSGDLSGWCATGGASGLDPETNDYPNNMDAWMVYGPFDLSDATEARLNFYFWNQSESDFDYFKYLASADGASFSGYQYSGDSGGWLSRSFDLANVPTLGNLCGDSSVWIAFKFDSDFSVTQQGAFVDDIVLEKCGSCDYPPLMVIEDDVHLNGLKQTSVAVGTGDPVNARFDARLYNELACPGCIHKVVVGLRDSAGDWAGGEPQVVLSDMPDICGSFHDNVSVPDIAAPSVSGDYTLWAGDILTASDSVAVSQFKARRPTAEGERDKRISSSGGVHVGCAPPVAPTNFHHTSKGKDQINWLWDDNSSDEDGFRVDPPGITRPADMPWWFESAATGSPLQPNTLYTRHAHAYNGCGDSAASNSDSTYTLPKDPEVDCNKSVGIPYPVGTEYTFTNLAGWGPGNLDHYHYVWDQSPGTAVSESDPTWSGGTLPLTGNLPGDWYLHVMTHNPDNETGGTSVFGAYVVDCALPAAPSNFHHTAKDKYQINWAWDDNSSDEDGFRVDPPGTILPPDSTSWPETGLSPNTSYTRHVHAYSASCGDSAPSNDDSTYTYAKDPDIGCDRTPGTPYPVGTVFTFTNLAGWGPGNLDHYHYVWDQSPGTPVSESDPTWSGGTLPLTGDPHGDWYLHVMTHNPDNETGGTSVFGAYQVEVEYAQTKVLLEIHPNERAAGVAGPLLGDPYWTAPVAGSTGGYTWKTYQFAGSPYLWIQVCAQAQRTSNTPSGTPDRLQMLVDGVILSDYWADNMAAPPNYQWNGNFALDLGRRKTLRFLSMGVPGVHTIRFKAVQYPIIWWIKVTDLEPGVIEPIE